MARRASSAEESGAVATTSRMVAGLSRQMPFAPRCSHLPPMRLPHWIVLATLVMTLLLPTSLHRSDREAGDEPVHEEILEDGDGDAGGETAGQERPPATDVAAAEA